MDVIISLSQYIAKVGISEFAERFGVKERTAASWRYGERFPRADQARGLVSKSGGELTMEMIYASATTTDKAA